MAAPVSRLRPLIFADLRVCVVGCCTSFRLMHYCINHTRCESSQASTVGVVVVAQLASRGCVDERHRKRVEAVRGKEFNSDPLRHPIHCHPFPECPLHRCRLTASCRRSGRMSRGCEQFRRPRSCEQYHRRHELQKRSSQKSRHCPHPTKYECRSPSLKSFRIQSP